MALGGGPLPRGRPGALARGVHADQDRSPARGRAVRPTSVEEGKELTRTGYRSNSAWISFPASSAAPVRFGVDRDSRIVIAITSNLTGAALEAGKEIQALFDVIAMTMRESRST